MNEFRAGFLLYFVVWLLLVLIPASWAVLINGGWEWLAEAAAGLAGRLFGG